MIKPEVLNEALEKGERLAKHFIDKFRLDYEYFEHDIFYGNPDAALTDIFFVLDQANRTIEEKDFMEAIEIIGVIRGKIDANEIHNRYAKLIQR